MVDILPALTRVIAGIPVPNTSLINSSIEVARTALPEFGYNHVMRTWLNGQAIINNLPPSNQTSIDQEAFGIAAILHDLGWAFGTEYVSEDKRFEVDGAIAARAFIERETKKRWSSERLQLVWDAIALHTTPDIAAHKQSEVALVSAATLTELVGPDIAKQSFGDLVTVTQSQWNAIAHEFPRAGLQGYMTNTLVCLCRRKPAATYQNFVGDWGEKYVEGYAREGNRFIDLFERTLPNKG